MAALGRRRGGGGPGAQFLPRDDDGNIVFNKKQDRSPPLFPKIERLPDLPTVSKRDEMLVTRRHHLQKAWECSPYYVEKTKAKMGRGRGRGSLPPGTTPWLLQTSLPKTDVHKLDQLASLEQKRLKDEVRKIVKRRNLEKVRTPMARMKSLEDEEEELGDDDYAQAFGFDDNEDYEVDDGGDDDGSVY